MKPTVSETNVRIRGRSATVVAGGLTAVLALAACGSGSGSSGAGSGGDATTLTLYNAQHEDLMKLMVAGFTKETGIKVNMRNGEDFELANQIVQEGKASPADVFVTENSPAMTLVDGAKGVRQGRPRPRSTRCPRSSPPRTATGSASPPARRCWPTTRPSSSRPQLPASIIDLAKPQWKGKIGIASAGADFQAIVSAVVALEGEAKAEQWLKGLKENAKVYRGNNAVMQAVDKGEIQAGVIYHYYWFKDQAESGDNSNNTSLHFFGNKDPGAFLSVSGAGVLATSKHQKQAQQLVTFLNGPEGQKILADSAAMEYPIGKGATANKALKPLTELDPPTVDVSTLNGSKVVELMQQAGLL